MKFAVRMNPYRIFVVIVLVGAAGVRCADRPRPTSAAGRNDDQGLRGRQLGHLRAQPLDFRVHGIGAGGCIAMLGHTASLRT
jgi:hypothetical protein